MPAPNGWGGPARGPGAAASWLCPAGLPSPGPVAAGIAGDWVVGQSQPSPRPLPGVVQTLYLTGQHAQGKQEIGDPLLQE